MKKSAACLIALLLCAVLVSMVFPAFAESEPLGNSEIRPRWTEISIWKCSMTRKDGLFSNVHAVSSVATYSAYSKVYLTVTVQQLSGGTYTDTSYTWSSSGNGFADVVKNLKLSTGTYRLKAVATIYSSSGQYIESDTSYSDDVVI